MADIFVINRFPELKMNRAGKPVDVLDGQGTVKPEMLPHNLNLLFAGLWAEHRKRGVAGYYLDKKKDNNGNKEKYDETQ